MDWPFFPDTIYKKVVRLSDTHNKTEYVVERLNLFVLSGGKKELIKSTFQADFRIGWNSFLLGFSGLSHYVNIIDFQYTYKIYTPIKDFEDNGVVAKLIYKDGLDFEMSLKLSLYKVNI